MSRKLRDKRLAFVDVETTGLDPSVHEMIEFAVIYSNGEHLSFKIQPRRIEAASPKALEVNGYTPERWVDAITPEEAAVRIAKALDDCVVAGYNVKFDVGFILSLLSDMSVAAKFGYHHVDVAALAYEHLVDIGLNSLSLKNVCKFLGIPPEPDIHEALNGARACREVYRRLVRAGWVRRQWWRFVGRL